METVIKRPVERIIIKKKFRANPIRWLTLHAFILCNKDNAIFLVASFLSPLINVMMLTSCCFLPRNEIKSSNIMNMRCHFTEDMLSGYY